MCVLARRHAEATTESEEKAKEARGQRETHANTERDKRKQRDKSKANKDTRANDGQTSSRCCTLNDSVSMVVSGLVHLMSDP